MLQASDHAVSVGVGLRREAGCVAWVDTNRYLAVRGSDAISVADSLASGRIRSMLTMQLLAQ